MNYKRIYDELIENRRTKPYNKKDGYCEYHHIIPVSIGGRDDTKSPKNNVEGTNIVGLTAREHYIAHLLLAKIYEGTKVENTLLAAVTMMRCVSTTQPSRNNYHFNGKLYESLRLRYWKRRKQMEAERPEEEKAKIRQHISENHADVSGEKNPMYGKNIKDFMTPENYALWQQHIQERNLSGENNGAYGRIWIRNIDTDQQMYLYEEEAEEYIKTGKWERGKSKSVTKKITDSIRSDRVQLKNLKTRFPNVDFSEFDFAYYRSLSQRRHDKYRYEYVQTHQIK